MQQQRAITNRKWTIWMFGGKKKTDKFHGFVRVSPLLPCSSVTNCKHIVNQVSIKLPPVYLLLPDRRCFTCMRAKTRCFMIICYRHASSEVSFTRGFNHKTWYLTQISVTESLNTHIHAIMSKILLEQSLITTKVGQHGKCEKQNWC